MGLAQDLQRLFGLDEGAVNYRTDLSKDELFDAAVAGDRGRVTPDGPDDAQKAFPTALGKEGPLVFYTDPSWPPPPRHGRKNTPRCSETAGPANFFDI